MPAREQGSWSKLRVNTALRVPGPDDWHGPKVPETESELDQDLKEEGRLVGWGCDEADRSGTGRVGNGIGRRKMPERCT